MFGNYIKSMPRLNDAEERKKKSLKSGPVKVTHKYTRATNSSGKSSNSTRCQRCENFGHYTYNCPVAHAPYKARPSRTQQLLNPKSQRDGPSVEVPEEFLTKKGIAEKILATNELERQEAQSKLVASKLSKKKTKPKASSDSSSSSSSDSDSTSDSDSDSDSDSNSTSSTTSSSSSGDSSDSSSASVSSGSSSPGRRRVKRRPSSQSSSIASRRYRHRSRSVSRKPIGSQTPSSPRSRDSPYRSHDRIRSPRPSAASRDARSPRQATGPHSRSPRRITSRSNPPLEISEYSRNHDRKPSQIKSSVPLRRHHHRSRSDSRGTARSRTPPSPKRRYSPRGSHRVRSPRLAIASRASPSQRRGSRLDSRSPRRKVSRSNSGYDSRGSAKERSRKTKAVQTPIPPRAYRHRSRSVARESFGSRTPPSHRRRYSPHRSDRRVRSPRPPLESRASLSPKRNSAYANRSRTKVVPPEPEYDSRGPSRDRRGKIEPTHSPRRNRPRPRSVSRESHKSRTPPSPRRRYSPHRSHKRGRSPGYSAGSRTPPSPRQSHRPLSRSPRRKERRPSYEHDSRGSVRARR